MSDTFPKCIRVLPARRPVNGSVTVPGSKSIGNRAILLAACATGKSVLRGILDSDDTRAALRALSALGVHCALDGDRAIVDGRGLDFPNKTAVLDIGSSGTAGRFLPGLLAAAPVGDWRLDATDQLAARPLRPLVDGLRQWGADLTLPDSGASFPLRVRAGGLCGGEAAVSAKASSQFASGLLLAAPLCREPAAVRIRDLDPGETYIGMTLDLMRRFGVSGVVKTGADDTVISFESPAAYRAADLTIEADANTANYFLALAVLTGGSVTVRNLGAGSGQPGVKFLDVYRRLGAAVTAGGNGTTVSGTALPLRGGFTIDMRAMSEMALTLGVMAVFADAPIAMTNLSHIRGHESDRIAALAQILADVGVRADETADSITVHPAPVAALKNVSVDPRDDHRLVMAFAVFGLAANGVIIENPGCVKKTCPGFFAMLQRISGHNQIIRRFE